MIMRFPKGLKKALTLSYDDGVEQDIELVRILDQHRIRATFNINSGLFAKEGMVYPEGQIHRRMPLSRAKALYGGSQHEVAVHGVTHASLPDLPPSAMTYEILKDRENLEHEFGGIIRGMAYAFGAYNDTAVDVLRSCGIAYSRTVHSTRDFSIPQDWLRLHPTCHHNDPQLTALCDRFLADEARFSSKLFYLWGHSYEFEAEDNWNVIRAFCEKMGGHPDIWYATNIEVADYVHAWRSLRASADGRRLHNPTALRVWAEDNGSVYEIGPGETVLHEEMGE